MTVFPKMIFERSACAFFSEIENYYGKPGSVFLGNPDWSAEQKNTAQVLMQRYSERYHGNDDCPRGRIFIASGGSGGKVRFVAHTPETLESSARALIEILKLPKGVALNCFSCLPPWHISGLMPFVRAKISGGELFVAENGSFRDEDSLPDFRKNADAFWMNSLVPTQLRRILALKNGLEWLRQFEFVLLGGAVVPADLIEKLKIEKLNVGIGYGMTETASLIALWRLGDSSEIVGTPLAHAKISIVPERSRIEISATSLGETLDENGELLINANGKFLTNDEGSIDEQGRLAVLGRSDRYINSGGEKIDPKEVEKALIQSGVRAALVVGELDKEWGSRVTAILEKPVPVDILNRVKKELPAWMVPKRFLCVSALPLDGKGKIDRAKLQAILSTETL